MEQGNVVPICFRDFLDGMCSALGFPRPSYNRSVAAVHECCIIVRRGNSPDCFTAVGGDEGSFDESAQRAARKMCFHLAEEYSVHVEDVSMGMWQEVEAIYNDFKLKRVQLDNVENGRVSLPIDEDAPIPSIFPPGPVVKIDFYSILEKIIHKFQVHVTPVEYLQYNVADFKAYLSISFPSTMTYREWICSDRCDSMVSAKHSLAKKVVRCLIPTYGFEINDINSQSLKRARMLLDLERESYLAIKERVYGVKEDLTPRPVLQEEAPLTPKGIESTIGRSLEMPLPPKKRPGRSVSRWFSDVIPQDLIPARLERVVSRREANNQ